MLEVIQNDFMLNSVKSFLSKNKIADTIIFLDIFCKAI